MLRKADLYIVTDVSQGRQRLRNVGDDLPVYTAYTSQNIRIFSNTAVRTSTPAIRKSLRSLIY